MEKNLTLQQRETSYTNIITATGRIMKIPFEKLRMYYSSILEREISYRQMWKLLNVQIAFVLSVFPADGPLAVRLACCAWFVYALRSCRK